MLDALRNERDATLSGVQDLLAFQTALADWKTIIDYTR